MLDIFINLLTIVTVISLLILIIIFKRNVKDIFHKISNKIKSLSTTTPKFTFEKFINQYTIIILFVYFSFIVFSMVLLHYLYNSKTTSNFLEITNVYNLICQITQGGDHSFEDISIFIILLSGFIVYTYFFGMMSDNPYNIMKNETQKKYFWFFENLYYIAVAYTIFIIGGLLFSKLDSFNPTELILLFYAWMDIILTLPIVNSFEKYQDDYNNIEKFNNFPNEKYKKNYEKLSHLLKRRLIAKREVCSVLIFLLTLEFAYIGYELKINIFCLIFLESSLILTNAWMSRINQTPKDKKTIELKSNQKLKDVYIAGETDDYLVIISKERGMSKIMKSSINQILYQNITETDE